MPAEDVQPDAASPFALLEHTTHDGVHWDLLIARPGEERLATWRLATNPLTAKTAIPAERIADHRRIYLEYEGAVRGDRGAVRRLDRGLARWLEPEAESGAARVQLHGALLEGDWVFAPTAGAGLTFASATG